jgi:hypothetical protein
MKMARLHCFARAKLLLPRAQLEALPALISMKPPIIVFATFGLVVIGL